MGLEQKLKSLQEREQDDLQNQMDTVKSKYLALPKKVNHVASLTGIPPEELVSICAELAWHYKDFTWDDMLEIIRSFQVIKMRREAEQEGKNNGQASTS